MTTIVVLMFFAKQQPQAEDDQGSKEVKKTHQDDRSNGSRLRKARSASIGDSKHDCCRIVSTQSQEGSTDQQRAPANLQCKQYDEQYFHWCCAEMPKRPPKTPQILSKPQMDNMHSIPALVSVVS